jgi:cysteine desulfurase/selenocysteine lyase
MKSLFQLDPDIIHLNHAAVGPWPVATRDAVIRFAEENASIGSQRYAHWMETEKHLKTQLATLINAASADEIALLKNTSEGLSMIARGIDFKPGDNVVVPAEEFPSNLVVWLALESQGVEIRLVEITTDDAQTPEQRLIDAMDEATRLLSCSSVQFARGLRLDLVELGRACRLNDTLFCVDAIQSLGAIAFDVQACAADFVVADGHKWLCAPEGTALFYCRQSVMPQMQLSQFGWHMIEDPFNYHYDGSPPPVHHSAQRFESGSPNMMGIHALSTSVSLLLDIGMDTIQQKVLENARHTQSALASSPDITLLSPVKDGRYAGIVTFRHERLDNEILYRHLQANNVLCANRGGGIRFSPHFHTDQAAIDRAVIIVNNFSD